MSADLDALAERYGFPSPVDTSLPGKPLLAAQIDLGEMASTRTTCCCAQHGSLHNPLDCCPVHKRVRAGLPIPPMTNINA